MRSMAKVLIVGNLTKDPEIMELESGIKMAKFTVATNRNWTNKEGEKFEQTDFHKVIAWRKLAEICGSYLRKGSAVLVEGKLSNNSFTSKEGKNVKVTEIQADEVNFIANKKNETMNEINLVEVPA
ncbi:MAG: single-stranded DNA-binding protein [Candidatus Altimarinota bacterium]